MDLIATLSGYLETTRIYQLPDQLCSSEPAMSITMCLNGTSTIGKGTSVAYIFPFVPPCLLTRTTHFANISIQCWPV